MRRAAVDLPHGAIDLDRLAVQLRATVHDLMQGGGEWRGPLADAFGTQVWQPIQRSLTSAARGVDQGAEALRRCADALEEAQRDRDHAEALAVVAGVGIALTVLTVGIGDAVGMEAAATAAALMTRAATAIAGAIRLVVTALEGAGIAMRAAFAAMSEWAPRFGIYASVSLDAIGRSPVGMGLLSAGATAAMGDHDPLDLMMAAALGYAVGKAGAGAEEEPPSPKVVERTERQGEFEGERFLRLSADPGEGGKDQSRHSRGGSRGPSS